MLKIKNDLYIITIILSLVFSGLFYRDQVTNLLWNNLGNVYFIKSLVFDNQNLKKNTYRTQEANYALSFFLQVNSNFPSARHLRSLALTYLILKRYTESQNAIRQAIHISPSRSLLFDEGRIYEAVGNRQAAILAWQKSNALQYFLDRGDRELFFEDRVYNYELSIQIAPRNPKPYYIFGDFLYYNSSEREKAISLYQTATTLDKNKSPQRYFALGKLAQHRADWIEAINNYQKAIKSGENSANLYMNLGDVLSEVGTEFKVISQMYEKAFEIEPLNKWPYLKMRNLYVNENQQDNLLVWYRTAVVRIEEEEPETAALMLYTLIEMHEDLGDCEIAIYLDQQVKRLNKNRLKQIQTQNNDNCIP